MCTIMLTRRQLTELETKGEISTVSEEGKKVLLCYKNTHKTQKETKEKIRDIDGNIIYTS